MPTRSGVLVGVRPSSSIKLEQSAPSAGAVRPGGPGGSGGGPGGSGGGSAPSVLEDQVRRLTPSVRPGGVRVGSGAVRPLERPYGVLVGLVGVRRRPSWKTRFAV